MRLFDAPALIRDPIPTVFVRDRTAIFLAVGILIPLPFAVERSSFTMLSINFCDNLMEAIKFLWPFAYMQYKATKDAGLFDDAASYGLFIAIFCLFACCMLALTCVRYIKERRLIKKPDDRDVMFM